MKILAHTQLKCNIVATYRTLSLLGAAAVRSGVTMERQESPREAWRKRQGQLAAGTGEQRAILERWSADRGGTFHSPISEIAERIAHQVVALRRLSNSFLYCIAGAGILMVVFMWFGRSDLLGLLLFV